MQCPLGDVTNRNDPISVVLFKVTIASKVGIFANKHCQWKYSFKSKELKAMPQFTDL
jgi:hypothetical protein